jgi:hypothetical protein
VIARVVVVPEVRAEQTAYAPRAWYIGFDAPRPTAHFFEDTEPKTVRCGPMKGWVRVFAVCRRPLVLSAPPSMEKVPTLRIPDEGGAWRRCARCQRFLTWRKEQGS